MGTFLGGINYFLPQNVTWTLNEDNSVFTINHPDPEGSDKGAGIIQFSVKGDIPSDIGGEFRLVNDIKKSNITLFSNWVLTPQTEIVFTRSR